MGARVRVCVCKCACVRVCVYLHIKVLFNALVYMILWFNNNVMDVVNTVMFCLVIISHDINEFLPGDYKDLLN